MSKLIDISAYKTEKHKEFDELAEKCRRLGVILNVLNSTILDLERFKEYQEVAILVKTLKESYDNFGGQHDSLLGYLEDHVSWNFYSQNNGS